MQKQNEAKKQGAKSRAQKKHQKAEREKKNPARESKYSGIYTHLRRRMAR